MKKITISLLLFCLFVLTACSNSNQTSNSDKGEDETYSFKIGSIVPESHVLSETVNVFKEELEKRTDGRLSLDYYPNATLGGEAEMLQQAQSGSLDMVFMSVAELSKSAEGMNFWSTPYLIEGYDDLYEIAGTDEAKVLFEEIEQVHPLGVFAVGMRHVLAKDDSISGIDNMKGKKIRVPASNINMDWWKSLDTVPTPVPLPELYTSFQTGVVDMIDIDLDAIVSNKYYEVGKYLTPLNHMIMAGGSIVSEGTWNKLSDEDKKIVEEAYEVAREFNRNRSNEKEEENLKAFKDNGGVTVDFEDEDKLLKVADEINEKYSSQNEKIKNIIERVNQMK